MPSILIVDDSPDIRRGVRHIFGSVSGWEVCEAINGKDGVEKAQLLKPDIIVLDISMPVMDGITAAKTLKALMPTLPIIIFSNFAEDEFLKQEVRSAGIGQVVSKSDSQALVHAVEEAFRA
jgi:CheY-like chemotaxis protein